MAKPEPQAEISLIVSAAHAINLDAPIIHYRILGERIELWTCHAGPFIYDPSQTPVAQPKHRSKSKKSAIRNPQSTIKE